MRNKAIFSVLSAAAVLAACGGESPVPEAQKQDYGPCRTISIVVKEASGREVTVTGCAGRVILFIDRKKIDRNGVHQLITANKGRLLEDSYPIGYCLAGVEDGGEAKFIAAVKNIPGILGAQLETPAFSTPAEK